MHKAIVTKLQNVRKHPNADRLQLADASGYQVIVGSNAHNGELGIVIPEGCALSREFCFAMGLYRKHPDTGELLGGYLDANGRVTCMRMRGERSEGVFISRLELQRGLDLPLLSLGREGKEIDTLGRCTNFVQKYETPAQLRAQAQRDAQPKPRAPGFKRHYDTPQFRSSMHDIMRQAANDGEIYITEKLHGTSGRTAKLRVSKSLAWYQKAWNFIAPERWAIEPMSIIKQVSGTRNTVLGRGAGANNKDRYRREIHDYLAPQLRVGECVYYEIVGFDERGTPIMSPHDMEALSSKLGSKQAKELRNQCGARMTYRYGCDPNGLGFDAALRAEAGLCFGTFDSSMTPQYRVFIYRITQMNEHGATRELPLIDAHERSEQIGWRGFVEFVPMLDAVPLGANMPETELTNLVNHYTRGWSTLDDSHIREGVCVRVDSRYNDEIKNFDEPGKAVKHKSFVFCTLEGIMANDPDYVDSEAVS